MIENINSGAEYAQILINSIQRSEDTLPANDKMDPVLFNYWTEEIKEKADETYTEYIVGKRESFLLNEEEMISLFKTATENYIQHMLNNMVDKDLLEVGINETGDIIYGLSDNGKEEANKLFGTNI
jgi:hypothetical protein